MLFVSIKEHRTPWSIALLCTAVLALLSGYLVRNYDNLEASRYIPAYPGASGVLVLGACGLVGFGVTSLFLIARIVLPARVCVDTVGVTETAFPRKKRIFPWGDIRAVSVDRGNFVHPDEEWRGLDSFLAEVVIWGNQQQEMGTELPVVSAGLGNFGSETLRGFYGKKALDIVEAVNTMKALGVGAVTFSDPEES